jgi:putative ABC transport system permease protein
MKLLDLFELSSRMFKTRPSRTWLTILGMGVGSGAVLFLMGLGYGLQNLLLERIVNSDTLLSLTITSAQPDTIILNNDKISELYKIKGVKDIAPTISFPSQMSLGELVGNVILKGVGNNYLKYDGITAKEGRLMDDVKKEIMVSEAVVQLFGFTDSKEIIGKKASIQMFVSSGSDTDVEGEVSTINFNEQYEIVGVVEGAESVTILFPLRDVAKEVETSLVYEMAKVRVSESRDIETVRTALLDGGFQVSSLSETIDQANKIFGGIQIALGFFGAVALMVATIGMVNTMTVTLLERTQEIGIMRAMGASKKDVLVLFSVEATIMGFLGGLAGLIIGILGGQIFNLIVNILAKAFGGQSINLFKYPLWFITTLMVVSGVVGFIAGFFPGKRASKLDPLDALRYK